MDSSLQKAMVLTEALPYIQKFRQAVVVIKFGGSAMENPQLVHDTMRDVVLMECIGLRPVVVHGGGKAISAELKKLDIPVEFVNGLRKTCARTIKVVDDVLHNQVNRGLVEMARECGGNAMGISGKHVLTARKTMSVNPATEEKFDVGFVGEIVNVDTMPIMHALWEGYIPVVTPLGTGEDDQVYNINADVAACRIAEALHARKLVFLSDVPGVLRDPSDEATVISTISTEDVPGLVKEKIISGGMLPKIQSCLEALKAGVNKVHLIDGRVRHSLLLELFTDSGVGTQIVKPDSL
ncbi:MAG: acetylglutamate kinase [Victivallaceae bacterium]|nr:acetylglutamate kinase [Victivallaceae bacterium]